MSQPFLSEREPAPHMADNAEFGLFYDTETTGIPLYKEPSDDPRQPHIVQLAAALVHLPTRQIVDTLNVLIRPDGWTIPQEVIAIHGITNERAQAEGIPEREALEYLLEFHSRADGKIAFNEAFDRRIVRIGLKRYFDEDTADTWYGAPFSDPCFTATDIMALEATNRMKATGRGKQAKKPKLAEAVLFFTGRELVGAHDAMLDVEGCMAVFFAIRDGVRQRVVLDEAAAAEQGFGLVNDDEPEPVEPDPNQIQLPIVDPPRAPVSLAPLGQDDL